MADAIFASATAKGDRLFVNVVVMCELVWVLGSAYGESRESIASVLSHLIETPEVVIEDVDLVRRALADYEGGAGDFADYLTARRNTRAGCGTTVTFDKSMRKVEGMTLA